MKEGNNHGLLCYGICTSIMHFSAMCNGVGHKLSFYISYWSCSFFNCRPLQEIYTSSEIQVTRCCNEMVVVSLMTVACIFFSVSHPVKLGSRIPPWKVYFYSMSTSVHAEIHEAAARGESVTLLLLFRFYLFIGFSCEITYFVGVSLSGFSGSRM